MAKCDRCRKSTEFKCGGCGYLNYCSKDCQVGAWSTHKPVCLEIKTMGLNNFLKSKKEMKVLSAMKSIHGNALISASYSNSNTIHIQIMETSDEFVKSGLHCVYLDTKNYSFIKDNVTINYEFTDCIITEVIPAKNLQEIKNKNQKPTLPWPIFLST